MDGPSPHFKLWAALTKAVCVCHSNMQPLAGNKATTHKKKIQKRNSTIVSKKKKVKILCAGIAPLWVGYSGTPLTVSKKKKGHYSDGHIL